MPTDPWDRAPQDLIHAPGHHAGLATLAPLPEMWRALPRPRIGAMAASGDAEISARIESHIRTHGRRRAFSTGVETATVPVVLQDVRGSDGTIWVGGRALLTGAAGTRLRNRYAWNNKDRDVDAQTAAWFARLRQACAPPPIVSGSIADLPFVIDLRNGTNFFHFLTETLPQLCALPKGHRGPIRIHLKGADLRPFLMEWVGALFPDLAARVRFESGEGRYARALSVLNARHWYGQVDASVIASLDGLAPDRGIWAGRDPDRMSVALLAMNSCDAMQRRLRDVAHAAIAGRDWSHLPRRVWVARRSARLRAMEGEAELVEALRARGFAVVHFEDLAPLEQVALMARAEVMASYHGAGFANMLFAGAETHCIEIGTLQTCLHRWQDFMPHAIASGCRYVSFFGDHAGDGPDLDDLRGKDLAPVSLGASGRELVLEYVDAVLARGGTARVAPVLSQVEDHAAVLRVVGDDASNPEQLILRANALQAEGRPAAAFAALLSAWEATGDRPFLLERLVVIGRRLGRDVSELETAHAQLFPERGAILRHKLARQG